MLIARADSLEVTNNSLINGKLMGGAHGEISIPAGSSLLK
jgi:hypothetical protein